VEVLLGVEVAVLVKVGVGLKAGSWVEVEVEVARISGARDGVISGRAVEVNVLMGVRTVVCVGRAVLTESVGVLPSFDFEGAVTPTRAEGATTVILVLISFLTDRNHPRLFAATNTAPTVTRLTTDRMIAFVAAAVPAWTPPRILLKISLLAIMIPAAGTAPRNLSRRLDKSSDGYSAWLSLSLDNKALISFSFIASLFFMAYYPCSFAVSGWRVFAGI
jgi:hypothetical protein